MKHRVNGSIHRDSDQDRGFAETGNDRIILLRRISRSLNPIFRSTALKNFGSTILTILVTGLILIAFFISPPIQSGDLDMRDILFQLRGEKDMSDSDIVIVEMSQQADAEIPYKYPWPTYVYAKLIENLNRAGARAIAFDVMFDQPDLYDARNDSIFAAAVREAGNVVFIGGFRRQADIRAGSYLIENITPVFPRGDLMSATPWNIGIVDMRRDLDGTIRTYPLQANHQGQAYYSLALQMMPLVLGDEVSYVNETRHYNIGDRRLPKTEQGRMLINYYGGYRTFNYESFESVIDDEDFQTVTEMLAFEVNEFDHPDYGLLYQDVLRDKIVLVGATMPELQDFHQVPFPNSSGEKTMAGVEIHAHALQTIIDGNFLKELSTLQNLIIVVLILIVSFYVTYLYVGWGGLIAAMLIGSGWSIFALFMFLQFNMFLPILPVYLAVLLGYTGSTMQNVIFEVQEKKKIKSMFSSYVSPDLVEKMVADEIEYKLGGSVENLTVLFSDIEDFTGISESLKPDELVSMMNRYLEDITTIVNDCQGTLDKYIGDAVMAFYGAPVASENHAADACRSALKSGIEWNDTFINERSMKIRTRFGINTGEMLVGNMGSARRFNYTVMGDQVNIGARCESSCKLFGVYVVVSESCKAEAEKTGEFLFRKMGRVRVKGKKEPLRLYQLVCFSENADEHTRELIAQFEIALGHYFDRNFKDALALFKLTAEFEETHLSAGAERNPSQLYIQKCLEMIKNKPDEMWKGVVEG
jgi:adenylate cyclase